MDRILPDVFQLVIGYLNSCNLALLPLKYTNKKYRSHIILFEGNFGPYSPKYQIRDLTIINVPLIIWYLKIGLPVSEDYYPVAAYCGNLQSIEYLKDTSLVVPRRETYEKAGEGGHCHILEWLDQNARNTNPCAIIGAARGGHLIALQWLLERGYGMSEHARYVAAAKGHVHILCYLGLGKCPYLIARNAVANGKTSVLEWLQKENYTLPAILLHHAVEKAQLTSVIWLYENGYSLNIEVMNLAASARYRLPILFWLREHNCPWDSSTMEIAKRKYGLPILNYLRNHGCPSK